MVVVYCPLCCDQPFDDQQSLFFHLRGLRNNLFCPICSERFSSLEYLVAHLSRKCFGPVSPAQAKKKCVAKVSSDCSAIEPIEVIDLEAAIPPELQRKLSKSVTLSVSPAEPSPLKRKAIEQLSLSVEKIPLSVENSVNGPSSGFATETPKNAGPKTFEKPSVTTKLTSPNKKSQTPASKPGPLCSKPSLEIIHIDSNLTPTKELVERKLKDSAKDPPTFHSLSEPPVPVSSAIQPTPSLKSPVQSSVPIKSATQPTQSLKSPVQSSVPIKSATQPTPSLKSPVQSSVPVSSAIQPTPSLKSPVQSSVPIKSATQPTPSLKSPVQSSVPVSSAIQPKPSLKSPMQSSVPIKSATLPTPSLKSPMPTPGDKPKRPRGRPRKFPPGTNPTLNSKQKEKAEPGGKTHDLDKLTSMPANQPNTHFSPVKKIAADKSKEFSLPVTEDQTEDDDNEEPMHGASGSEDEKLKQSSKNKKKTEKESSNDSKVTGDATLGDGKTEEEDEYTCSACNIRFTSIYNHIKQYHNGEEVVVEVPQEEIEDLKAYQNENDLNIAVESESSTSSEYTSTEKGKTKTPEKVKDEESVFSKPSAVPKKIPSSKLLSGGKWVHTASFKKDYYQYINDPEKLRTLVVEIKNNRKNHPDFHVPVKELFQNPKINVVEITNKPNTPFVSHRVVDFKKPIPMYIVERQANEPENILGGIASYVIANPSAKSLTFIPDDSKVIAVMKVILASDNVLTVENIVFKDKPANENMIPIVEDVVDTDRPIPLLKNAKILKWMCTKCRATTWKFPLTKDSHICNACTVCHKPFASFVSLRKHMAIHRKDGLRYCGQCHVSFTTAAIKDRHVLQHKTHSLCALCNMFLPVDQLKSHQKLHDQSPDEQFPCSACHKVFPSGEEVKAHEAKVCARLVAKYNCSLCDKKFFSLAALSYHTRDHRDNKIKYPCHFCAKTFTREKEQNPRKAGKRKPSAYIRRIWHERIHTRDRPYSCSACPKRFRAPVHRVEHMDAAHRGSVPRRDLPIHMCRLCDLVFSNASRLHEHVVSDHSDPLDTVTQ